MDKIQKSTRRWPKMSLINLWIALSLLHSYIMRHVLRHFSISQWNFYYEKILYHYILHFSFASHWTQTESYITDRRLERTVSWLIVVWVRNFFNRAFQINMKQLVTATNERLNVSTRFSIAVTTLAIWGMCVYMWYQQTWWTNLVFHQKLCEIINNNKLSTTRRAIIQGHIRSIRLASTTSVYVAAAVYKYSKPSWTGSEMTIFVQTALLFLGRSWCYQGFSRFHYVFTLSGLDWNGPPLSRFFFTFHH